VTTAEDAKAETTSPDDGRRITRRLHDVLGIGWIIAAGGAFLSPALARGSSLGSYTQLLRVGLSQGPLQAVRNPLGSDQITQMIPWAAVSWTEVHAGHLPLWNPYNALGMPLAFNWQSAVFSLPNLVGYLFPLRLAYTAQVLTTLVVAGSGAYVLARVLRCGAVAAAFAGTVFELSGAFMIYLGWPIASVFSWSGWLLAATILVIRGQRRARYVALFALILALAVYAGQPDALTILLVALAVFVVVLLGQRLLLNGPPGPVLRPLIDLALAGVAGFALSAPLLLPGAQVLGKSIRNSGGSALGGRTAIPYFGIGHFLVSGLDGGFIADSLYLGVIPVVFAITAIGLRRKQPEVISLVGLALSMAALCFVQPIITILVAVPGLEAVRWTRAVVLLVLPLAVLGGMGLDLLIRSPLQQSVRRWIGSGFLLTAVILLGFCLAGGGPLSPAEASNRFQGLVWPAIEAALGIAVAVGLRINARRSGQRSRSRVMLGLGVGQWCAIVMLACETAFLIAVGSPMWDSSPSYLPVTSAEVALQRAVGSSVVGLGAKGCEFKPSLGIKPNVNAMLGIQELAVYDPMLPGAYFQSWTALTGGEPNTAGYRNFSSFCPPITSATLARAYGVSFVLEAKGSHGPTGGVFDEKIGNETLYRIPHSGVATLTPISVAKTTSDSVIVPVTHAGPASWKLITHGTTTESLRLRLTDSPGWHATIDGRPLKLTTYQSVMIQAQIPSGTHTVILTYLPGSFTSGIAIALCSVIALTLALLSGRLRKRRRPGVVNGEPQPESEDDPSKLQAELSFTYGQGRHQKGAGRSGPDDEDAERGTNRQARTRLKRSLDPDDEDAEQRASRQARARLKRPLDPDEEDA
jgi:hypothetical protein